MDPNSPDRNNPMYNQPQGGGFPQGQQNYGSGFHQSHMQGQNSNLNQYQQGSPGQNQGSYRGTPGGNSGQGSQIQNSGTPQGFGYNPMQQDMAGDPHINTSHFSHGSQRQVGGPPTGQTFGSGANIPPAYHQANFEPGQTPSHVSYNSTQQQVNRSIGSHEVYQPTYNNIPPGFAHPSDIQYSHLKQGYTNQSATAAPMLYSIARNVETYEQVPVNPAGVSSHLIPAPPPQPTTVTSVMQTHSIQSFPEPQYQSRNLNQIANEIRNSQARSVRQSLHSVSPAPPPPPPQSQVIRTVQTTTTTVVEPAVDPEDPQQKNKVCGCCPKWLCIILGILFLIGMLVGLFFAIRNLMNKQTAAQCPTGSVRSGNACIACPEDQVWNGSECIKSASSAELNETTLVGVDKQIVGSSKEEACSKGYHRYNGKCIKCPETSTWNGTDCQVDVNFPPYKIVEPPKPTPKPQVVEPIKQKKVAQQTKPSIKQQHPIKQEGSAVPAVVTPTIQRPQIIPHCQSGYIFYQGHCVPLIAHSAALKKHHLDDYLQKELV